MVVEETIELANSPASFGESAPATVTDPPEIAPAPELRLSLVRWSSLLCEQLIRAVDFVIMLLAGVITTLAAQGPPVSVPGSILIGFTAVISLMPVYLLMQVRSYRVIRFGQVLRPLIDLSAVLLVTLVIAEAVGLIASITIGGHVWLLSWTALSFVGMALARQVERPLVARGLRMGLLRRKVVLIGATPKAEHLIEQIRLHDRDAPSEIVGIYDDRGTSRRPDAVSEICVRGDVEALCTYAAAHPVDLIVITLPWQRAMDIFKLIQRVQWISADVMIPMEDSTSNPRMAGMVAVAGLPALQVARQPLPGACSLLKLVEDYVVATVGIILLAPLMLASALAIKLDGPGPIFFRQTRVGYKGSPFSILKFRTMVVDPSDSGVVGVSRNDPRITRVGGILRRLSIDEMPQLFNVMRGEMSVVGPRAHVPGMLVAGSEYAKAVSEYAARHRLKPGITGLAQVNGMRGGIHSIVKAQRGVDLDMSYVENWSLALDFRIMARTLLVGMFGSKVF